MTHTHFRELDLDLVFEMDCMDDYLLALDDSIRHQLSHQALWHSDLAKWINFIRSDLTLTCPQIVRLAQSLSLGVRFTDDATIAKLNADWRKKYCKTDVLSFPVLDENIVLPLDKCVELGDIVVSVPTAQSQAIEQNHGLVEELRWLVSHGLLHLLGWTHPNTKNLNEMLVFQKQLLDMDCMVQHRGVETVRMKDVF